MKKALEAANLGCSIIPPMMTFYSGAESLDEQIDYVIGKILLQFGIKPSNYKTWE